MKSGRLIAVVGPSGAGKDSIMAGIVANAPQIKLVQRVITRAPDLGGEEYEAMTAEAFNAAEKKGLFCISWRAHDLHYGIPAHTRTDVLNGHQCLANVSRGALTQAAKVFPSLKVLNITATPQTLVRRLIARDRETECDIKNRLALASKPLPENMDVVTINNNGALDNAIADALRALQPVKA